MSESEMKVKICGDCGCNNHWIVLDNGQGYCVSGFGDCYERV